VTTERLDFPSVTGSQQIQVRQINFGRTVRDVAVILQGFDIHCANGDHHVLEESIQVSAFVLSGGVVDVSADLLLRDGSETSMTHTPAASTPWSSRMSSDLDRWRTPGRVAGRRGFRRLGTLRVCRRIQKVQGEPLVWRRLAPLPTADHPEASRR
jgi:hypothetical protein